MNPLFAYTARCTMLGSIVFLVSTAVHAQVLEEIVVTAQKREERLQDVGISVTAFSSEQLSQLGFNSTLQLGMHTPGLLVTDTNAGTTTAFTMRGSGQLDFADHQEPPVAVYVDGAYNSFLGGVGFKFFDLERVEVLRGPQGTLFGRNATGGVVQLISKRPTEAFEGYAEATGGQYGLARLEAAVNGPLSDKVLGRLSVFFENTDGYQENRIGKNLNAVENKSGRAQLLFNPRGDVQFLISGQWNVDDNTAQGYDIVPAITDSFIFGPIVDGADDGLVKPPPSDAAYQSFCQNFFLVTPAPDSSNCFSYVEPNDGVHKVANNLNTYFKRRFYDATGTLTWNMSQARLVAITDYKHFTKHYLEDSDSSPLTLMTFPQTVDATQFSQEVRLEGQNEKFNWVGGAYYLDIDGKYDAGVDVTNTLAVAFDNNYRLRTKSWAVFAQSQYWLSKTWGATLGLRWTDDSKRMVLDASCIEAIADICSTFFGGLVQVTGLPPVSRSEGNWSGTFRIDYKPSEDLLIYGGVTRGQKAGGFNAGAVTLFAPDQVEYRGELLTNVEAGFKARLFGSTTRLNGSLFHYDYQNFQTFSQLGGALVVFNVDAKVLGSEIELVTQPFKGWEFMLGGSWLDAKQKHLAFGGVTKDRPMPNAPDVSVNGLVRHEWPLAEYGTMSAQVDFSYIDKRSLNAIDHPGLIAAGYALFNARIGYKSADDRWEGSLFVNNLSDKVYFHTIFDISTLTGSLQRIPGPPRWFGASISYKWK